MTAEKVIGPDDANAPEMPKQGDPSSDLKVLAFLWGKLGTFAFLVSFAAFLGMMSQQGIADTLKIPELGAYTLTLFSVPLLSIMIVCQALIARRHVEIAPSVPGSTVFPVGWKIAGLGSSNLRIHLAVLSVVANLGLPMIVNAWSLVKFSHGTYYWQPPTGGSCGEIKPNPETCVAVGTALTAFWPSEHGIGDPTHTRYIFEGNKDFLPVIQPVAYVVAVLVALGMGLRIIIIGSSGPRSALGEKSADDRT